MSSTATWADFARAVRVRIDDDLAHERRQATQLRTEVIGIVEGVTRRMRARGLLKRVWLFGSFAWDEPRPSSDIDLLVEDCDALDALAYELMLATQRMVHLVPLEQAPAALVERCLREGKPL